MLWNLISWTGWAKEDYINLFWNIVGFLISIVGIMIFCLFAYGIFFAAAFVAGC